MLRCVGMEKDYPKRVQAPGGVVHAARDVNLAPYTFYEIDELTRKSVAVNRPTRVAALPACGRSTASCVEIDPTTPITCKNCLREIGGEQFPNKYGCKYALQEIASGYFYNKDSYKNHWVEDIYRATLYRTEQQASANGNKHYYKHITSGDILSTTAYRGLPSEKKREYRYTYEFDPEKYVVREVKLEVL